MTAPPGALGNVETRALLAVIEIESDPAAGRPTVRGVASRICRSVGRTHDALVVLRDADLVTWERGRQSTLRSTVQVVG